MSWLSHQSCLWSDVSSCVRWVWLYWVRWLTANTPSADLGLCQGPGGCIKPPSCTRQQQPLLLRITEMLPLLNVAYISWSRPQSQFSFLTVWRMSLLRELYRWAVKQCDGCHPAAAISWASGQFDGCYSCWSYLVEHPDSVTDVTPAGANCSMWRSMTHIDDLNRAGPSLTSTQSFH